MTPLDTLTRNGVYNIPMSFIFDRFTEIVENATVWVFAHNSILVSHVEFIRQGRQALRMETFKK